MKPTYLRPLSVVLMASLAHFAAAAPSVQAHKMTTDIPASITIADEVKTRLGTLKFSDGRPDQTTVAKLYDNLDFQRGVQAFLNTNAAASMRAMKHGLRSQGADNRTAALFETLTDSRSLFLTANTETVYVMMWLDTRDGPLVVESPPNFLGLVNDAWQRYVQDIGNAGPDKGKGGKFLLLPPGYKGEVPEGYHVVRSPTYGNWVGGRGFVVNGDPRPATDNIKKHWKVYPLAQAGNPPEGKFVNVSGKSFNTIHANDFSYWQEIDEVVQSEPLEAVEPEARGLLAAIGIRKGSPFAPDARMKRILGEAATVGAATVRAMVYDTRGTAAFFYPDSNWRTAFVGGSHEFSPNGVLDIEARSLFFYAATGITPAMAFKMIGVGSQYAYATHDAAKQVLDGGKTYRMRMPAGIPAKHFWSLIAYDTQTRSYLQTDQQFPSIGNQRAGLVVNADTSVDVYFGPKPPPGKESNWVQTIPGKGWWVMLRLYGPLQPWFDKSWKPGEIELMK